jgi:hypothetical protein
MLKSSWEMWAVKSKMLPLPELINTTPVLGKVSNANFGKIFSYTVNSLDSTAMKQTCTLNVDPTSKKECPTPPPESAVKKEVSRESWASKVINDGLDDRHILYITSWPHLVPTQSTNRRALKEKLPRVIEIDFHLSPRLFFFFFSLKSRPHAPCMPSRCK